MVKARFRAALLGAALAVLPAGAAVAQMPVCRLALALALDVSASVDAEEDALQRRGLAAALTAPEVQAAFFSAPGPVALAIFEWSGRWNQELILDWRIVRAPSDLAAAAQVLAASERSYADFPTAMGYALGYGAQLFERAPDCLFRTIDMAGDGTNNEGFGPLLAYREFPFASITVNGLIVTTGDTSEDDKLRRFYRTEVLHGPGAFLEEAQGFEDYERAMRRKLEREVAARAIGALPRRRPGAPG